jgi:hypothetical protein
MTLTPTYDSQLNRVKLNCTSLGAAVSAIVSRSTDQIVWTTVRGGGNVVITSGTMAEISDYEFVNGVINYYKVDPNTGADQTANITPSFTQLWLKSVARPFLNMSFTLHEIVSAIRRKSRNGVFEVIGRTLPVGVTDVRLGRNYTLMLVTETAQQASDLDLLLASGDILFLHPPTDWLIPKGHYIMPGDYEEGLRWTTTWRVWQIPVEEIAAVGSDVVGSTATWTTVTSTYATWADVVAAHSSWASLLTLIGDPSEVIVP